MLSSSALISILLFQLTAWDDSANSSITPPLRPQFPILENTEDTGGDPLAVSRENGTLWLQTHSGLRYRENGAWIEVPRIGSENELWMPLCVRESPEGKVWVGSFDGVFRGSRKGIMKVPLPEEWRPVMVSGLAITGEDEVLASLVCGSKRRLLRINGEQWSQFEWDSEYELFEGSVFAQTDDGTVWITGKSGLLALNQERSSWELRVPIQADYLLRFVAQNSNNHGIVVFRPTGRDEFGNSLESRALAWFGPLDEPSPLTGVPDYSITSTSVDRSGAIRILQNTGTLYTHSGEGDRWTSTVLGPEATPASSVAQSDEGETWIITRSSLYHIPNRGTLWLEWHAPDAASEDNSVRLIGGQGKVIGLLTGVGVRIISNYQCVDGGSPVSDVTSINSLAIDRENRVWVSTQEGQIWFSESPKLWMRGEINGLVQRVLSDTEGEIYALISQGDDRRLYVHSDGAWSPDSRVDGAVDRVGFGSDGSLWSIRDRVLQVMSKDGESKEIALEPHEQVYGIYPSGRGGAWLDQQMSGEWLGLQSTLICLDGSNGREPLEFSRRPLDMALDQNGEIWWLDERSLCHFDGDEVTRIDHHLPTARKLHFAHDRFLIGTLGKGLHEFYPEVARYVAPTITSVTISTTEDATHVSVDVSYLEGQLDGSSVRLRYRWSDSETWSPWTESRILPRRILDEGQHEIFVEARSPFGVQSNVFSRKIDVPVDYWGRWSPWLITICGVCVAFGLMRTKTRRIQGHAILKSETQRVTGIQPSESSQPLERSAEELGTSPLEIAREVAASESSNSEISRRRRRLEGLGILAGSAVHDFRNALFIMINNADEALLKIGEGADAESNVRSLMEAANEATELVDQLMAYGGHRALKTAPTNVDELLQGALKTVRASLPPHVEVSISTHACPPFSVDITRFRRVLINLILNAGAAISAPGGRIRIGATGMTELRIAPDGQEHEHGWIKMYVQDNGRGMSPETLVRIFDPFFTTRLKGNGLGLAAVRCIVEAHGGTVDVESELGLGTVFTLRIPINDNLEHEVEID